MVTGGGAMGGGDRHLRRRARRHHHGGGAGRVRDEPHDQQQRQQVHVPKGCLAVMVGREGEQQQRFVVPVAYLRHPRFLQLLKKAEDEYGFEQKGAIAIPCPVEDFRAVQGLIDQEFFSSPDHGGCAGGHSQHLHLHHTIVSCFRP